MMQGRTTGRLECAPESLSYGKTKKPAPGRIAKNVKTLIDLETESNGDFPTCGKEKVL